MAACLELVRNPFCILIITAFLEGKLPAESIRHLSLEICQVSPRPPAELRAKKERRQKTPLLSLFDLHCVPQKMWGRRHRCFSSSDPLGIFSMSEQGWRSRGVYRNKTRN